MPLVNAKCTNCGTNLRVDNKFDAAICKKCGAAYIVEKAISFYKNSNQTINFELNEHHRNIPDEELLADIRRVATKMKALSLSKREYSSLGRYNAETIANRFGSWNKALLLAGLKIKKSINRNPNNIDVSDEELINDIISVCKEWNVNTITSTDYDKIGMHGRRIIIKRFGSWEKALCKAGLSKTGYRRNISDEELMDSIEQMWIKLGRQPTTNDVKDGLSKISLKVYYRRFGSWRKALESFIEYINEEDNKNNDTNNKETAIKNDLKYTAPSIQKRIHKTTRKMNLRLRFRVMQRDNFKCCICGASPAKDPSVELHIDHIIPWSKGGETVIDNLQTLCSKCNLGKSDLV